MSFPEIISQTFACIISLLHIQKKEKEEMFISCETLFCPPVILEHGCSRDTKTLP